MRYPVVVESNSEDEYTAEPLGKPELRVVAPTEAEALEKVGRALGEWLGSAKWVELEVPVGKVGDPWLDGFGRSADDPDFEEYLQEIERARS